MGQSEQRKKVITSDFWTKLGLYWSDFRRRVMRSLLIFERILLVALLSRDHKAWVKMETFAVILQ